MSKDVRAQMWGVRDAVDAWVAAGERRFELLESFSTTDASTVIVRQSGEVVRYTYALFCRKTGAQVGTIRLVIRAHLDSQAVWWEANGQGNEVLKSANVPIRQTREPQ